MESDLYLDVFGQPSDEGILESPSKQIRKCLKISDADESSIDIYGDLSMDTVIQEESFTTFPKLSWREKKNDTLAEPKENGKQLILRLEEVLQLNAKLMKENEALLACKEQLTHNMTSLHKTARKTIQEKDQEISKLRNFTDGQKQNVLLPVYSSATKGVQTEPSRTLNEHVKYKTSVDREVQTDCSQLTLQQQCTEVQNLDSDLVSPDCNSSQPYIDLETSEERKRNSLGSVSPSEIRKDFEKGNLVFNLRNKLKKKCQAEEDNSVHLDHDSKHFSPDTVRGNSDGGFHKLNVQNTVSNPVDGHLESKPCSKQLKWNQSPCSIGRFAVKSSENNLNSKNRNHLHLETNSSYCESVTPASKCNEVPCVELCQKDKSNNTSEHEVVHEKSVVTPSEVNNGLLKQSKLSIPDFKTSLLPNSLKPFVVISKCPSDNSKSSLRNISEVSAEKDETEKTLSSDASHLRHEYYNQNETRGKQTRSFLTDFALVEETKHPSLTSHISQDCITDSVLANSRQNSLHSDLTKTPVTHITCTSNLIILGDEETTCASSSPNKSYPLPSEFYPPGMRGQVPERGSHVRHIRGEPMLIENTATNQDIFFRDPFVGAISANETDRNNCCKKFVNIGRSDHESRVIFTSSGQSSNAIEHSKKKISQPFSDSASEKCNNGRYFKTPTKLDTKMNCIQRNKLVLLDEAQTSNALKINNLSNVKMKKKLEVSENWKLAVRKTFKNTFAKEVGLFKKEIAQHKKIKIEQCNVKLLKILNDKGFSLEIFNPMKTSMYKKSCSIDKELLKGSSKTNNYVSLIHRNKDKQENVDTQNYTAKTIRDKELFSERSAAVLGSNLQSGSYPNVQHINDKDQGQLQLFPHPSIVTSSHHTSDAGLYLTEPDSTSDDLARLHQDMKCSMRHINQVPKNRNIPNQSVNINSLIPRKKGRELDMHQEFANSSFSNDTYKHQKSFPNATSVLSIKDQLYQVDTGSDQLSENHCSPLPPVHEETNMKDISSDLHKQALNTYEINEFEMSGLEHNLSELDCDILVAKDSDEHKNITDDKLTKIMKHTVPIKANEIRIPFSDKNYKEPKLTQTQLAEEIHDEKKQNTTERGNKHTIICQEFIKPVPMRNSSFEWTAQEVRLSRHLTFQEFNQLKCNKMKSLESIHKEPLRDQTVSALANKYLPEEIGKMCFLPEKVQTVLQSNGFANNRSGQNSPINYHTCPNIQNTHKESSSSNGSTGSFVIPTCDSTLKNRNSKPAHETNLVRKNSLMNGISDNDFIDDSCGVINSAHNNSTLPLPYDLEEGEIIDDSNESVDAINPSVAIIEQKEIKRLQPCGRITISPASNDFTEKKANETGRHMQIRDMKYLKSELNTSNQKGGCGNKNEKSKAVKRARSPSLELHSPRQAKFSPIDKRTRPRSTNSDRQSSSRRDHKSERVRMTTNHSDRKEEYVKREKREGFDTNREKRQERTVYDKSPPFIDSIRRGRGKAAFSFGDSSQTRAIERNSKRKNAVAKDNKLRLGYAEFESWKNWESRLKETDGLKKD